MFINNYKKIYKPSILLIIFILLVSGAYKDTVQYLVGSWLTNLYSHGLLLFLVCCYLFYVKWSACRENLVFMGSPIGIALLSIVSLIWLAANLTFVRYVELVSLPLILAALLVSLLGWRQSKGLLFPVLLLLLAGPLLGVLVPVLQNITANLTGLLLEITGITSLVDGVLILVPAGTFEVDTSCSGLNVLTVGLILSLVYSYINQYSTRESLLISLLGILVSIMSNVVRVFIIVVVGNNTQMQHPLVEDHMFLGWVVFTLLFGIFLFLVHRLWPPRVRVEEAFAPPNNNESRDSLFVIDIDLGLDSASQS